MTNVLVTCAGHGQRFVDAGIDTPKPIIPVDAPTGRKEMVKLTTESLPFVDNMAEGKVAFAVLQEHIDEWYIDTRLRYLYNEPHIITFDKVTRGNLETAYMAATYLRKNYAWDENEPVLILDSDNKYDGSRFLDFVSNIKTKDFATICYFEPINDKTHWCFAQLDILRVFNLMEKDPNALKLDGKPMVGVFYFSSLKLFLDTAEEVLMVRAEEVEGEYYMSQAIQCLLKNNKSVYGCPVTDVVPLGTPEDVNLYENLPIRIAIDLDDTILHCKKAHEDYGDEELQEGVIETLNRWKDQGHYIIIHTARHTRTCEGNLGMVLARQGLTTLQWLEDNKVPYDEIWWSKPHADIFIDDKGFRHVPGDWQSTELAVSRFIDGETI